jgi:CRP-like cAMP-binding protein
MPPSLLTADELQSIDSFRALSQPAALALVSHSRVRSFSPNESLFREGEESHGIFIVLEGEVRVVRSSRGRRHVFHTERRGGTLGEAPFFDGEPYPASAVAMTPVRVVYIERGDVERVLRTNPEIALFFLSRLAGRVRILLDRVDGLATANVETRLVEYLLERAAQSASTTIGITQESLAEELGTVREVVMRTLRSLRQQGLIRSAGRGKIELLDAARLRALVSERAHE